ncbi:N-acetyltransferase [uncultured Cohaesibacter sp.]|uniref:GNAT family N-acetyltransferase n=1 Tax=uncultured Cohaesibacter sp. TaxID=1002546 RepID=UPI00292D0F80|nr:N-acetyltransferase [uncultured Cohaesibacter sp.]
MGSDLTSMVREARPEDASALAGLCIEVWLHTYCRPGIPSNFADYALATYSKANLACLIQDPDAHLLVETVDYPDAKQEGLRGLLHWSDKISPPLDRCPAAEIVTLYVRDRHKGQGIGSALLSASYREMQEAGHRSAFLSVNAENVPAAAFYLHLGFEEIGETHFEIDGGRYRNLVLQKDFV